MTNEELAVSLLAIFKPFGPVVSVKASRDHRGRPFGFVEYSCPNAASSALAYAPFLTLDSRRIRVEPAKRQRKLCIKWRLPHNSSLKVEEALEEMRRVLQERVGEEEFKLSLQGGVEAESVLFEGAAGEEDCKLDLGQVIAAVVKFEDPQKAKSAFEVWQQGHPEWSMTWINMDRSAFGSNVRNSGLVQLVPGKDGTIFVPPAVYGLGNSRYASPPPFLYDFGGGNVSPAPVLPTMQPRYMPSYEEETFTDTDHLLSKQLETLSVNDISVERDEDREAVTNNDLLSNWLGCTVFVGRLNGQYVTLAQLHEKFRRYGQIGFIRLYNRGVVGFDGVPLDAYAFIKYIDGKGDPVGQAIAEEHGKAWLGQAIKCEQARPAALSILLSATPSTQTVPRSPPYPPTSPFQLGFPVAFYYPAAAGWGISPVQPSDPTTLKSGKNGSNWFRARTGASNGIVASKSISD